MLIQPRYRFTAACLISMVLLLASLPDASAQEQQAVAGADERANYIDITAPVGSQSGPFSVGIGSSWPAYGISGTYRVNELVTAEAILGIMGVVQSFAGRGWYRFAQDPTYDVYGYLTAGVFRYDYNVFDAFGRVSDTESVFGIGGGVGIELSWAKILDKPDFPPIYTNLDLGFVHANFDYYDWSGIGMGGGIHYRFGN